MIKRMVIDNFESHIHTELNFGSGFNVIHGTSNVGKSSILRCLAFVAFGEWAGGENKKKNTNGPVRVGSKFCTILVETDMGSVFVKKGLGVNEWIIKNNTTNKTTKLSAPGSGPVKEAQDIIGFSSREIAGLNIRFNWSDQRDKHFIIDEVDGKSASPSLVAAVLDEVAGIRGFEELVRDMACDKTSLDKTTKKNQEKLSTIDSELIQYDGLDDQLEKLNFVSSLLDTTTELQQKITLANNITLKRKQLSDKVVDITLQLDKLNDVEHNDALIKEALNKLSNCKTTLANIDKAREFMTLSKLLKQRMLVAENTVRKYSLSLDKVDTGVNSLSTLLQTIDVAKNILLSYNKTQTAIISVEAKMKYDIGMIQTTLDKCDVVVDKLKTARNLQQKRLSSELRQTTMLKRLNKANELLKINKLNYTKMVDSIDICPLTNSPLVDECREKLHEEIS